MDFKIERHYGLVFRCEGEYWPVFVELYVISASEIIGEHDVYACG